MTDDIDDDIDDDYDEEDKYAAITRMRSDLAARKEKYAFNKVMKYFEMKGQWGALCDNNDFDLDSQDFHKGICELLRDLDTQRLKALGRLKAIKDAING